MFRQIIVCIVIFFTIPLPVTAGDDLFAELQVSTYIGRSDSGYTGMQLYAEKSLGETNTSVFGMFYHDEAFKEAQVGLAQRFTEDLQIGVGFGKARYEDESRWVISPWLYYAREDIEAIVLAEFYANDPEHFVKGYIHKGVTERMSAGLYGETALGIGPMVRYRVTDSLNVWGAVPVFDRGDVKGVTGVVIQF